MEEVQESDQEVDLRDRDIAQLKHAMSVLAKELKSAQIDVAYLMAALDKEMDISDKLTHLVTEQNKAIVDIQTTIRWSK